MMSDQNAFARAEDVQVGDVLVADGGFTCLPAGAERVVQFDERGELCIACSEGLHMLEGQLGYTPETDGLYVGLSMSASAADAGAGMSPGAHAIRQERQRQIDAEGWSREHDDAHTEGELFVAGSCYRAHALGLMAPSVYNDDGVPKRWPWDRCWWKPKGARFDLVRAGALILADGHRRTRAGLPITNHQHWISKITAEIDALDAVFVQPPAAIALDLLTALRRASVARQAEWGGNGAEPLPVLFKATELGGEAGEVLNVIKKLERKRLGWTGSRATVEDLAGELADLVICADLLAEPYNIDLGAAIVRKFNMTSEQRGLTTRIASQVVLSSGAEQEASSHVI